MTEYFMKIGLVKHVKAGVGLCQSAVWTKTTKIESHVTTCFWFVLLPTINGRPLTQEVQI